MANIKFGNGWADARGKVGGVVYSRNRSGAYARTYVKPTNPRTPAQVISRNRFSYVSSSYRGLTDAERNAWAYSASQVTYPNKVGDQVHPTASQYFNKQNMAIFSAGGTAIVTTPSALVDVVGVVNAELSAGVTAGVVGSFDMTAVLVDGTTAVPANHYAYIYATPTLSNGISRPQPAQFSLMTVLVAIDSLTSVDLLTAYTDVFGAPTADGNIWLSIAVINGSTGQASQRLDFKVAFTATP